MYGKEIKEQRTKANLSQIELSKKTKIAQQTISWIESDKGLPNILQCVTLADYYGISLDELIGREIPKNWKGNSKQNQF